MFRPRRSPPTDRRFRPALFQYESRLVPDASGLTDPNEFFGVTGFTNGSALQSEEAFFGTQIQQSNDRIAGAQQLASDRINGVVREIQVGYQNTNQMAADEEEAIQNQANGIVNEEQQGIQQSVDAVTAERQRLADQLAQVQAQRQKMADDEAAEINAAFNGQVPGVGPQNAAQFAQQVRAQAQAQDAQLQQSQFELTAEDQKTIQDLQSAIQQLNDAGSKKAEALRQLQNNLNDMVRQIDEGILNNAKTEVNAIQNDLLSTVRAEAQAQQAASQSFAEFLRQEAARQQAAAEAQAAAQAAAAAAAAAAASQPYNPPAGFPTTTPTENPPTSGGFDPDAATDIANTGSGDDDTGEPGY